MGTLSRRLRRLEAAQPAPSPFDAMAPILAEMSTHDLLLLIHHSKAISEGRRPTVEQEAVCRQFWDQFRLAVGMRP
jgi:hypothetical protein